MPSLRIATLLILAVGMRVVAEEPEISWNKSFINARREAATQGHPLVLLFCDRISLDYYDDALGRDETLRAVQAGVVWCKADREKEPELAKRMGVKAPWEVRIVAPDLTVLKAYPGKPKAAEVAAFLKSLRKVWSARGGPKAIDWMFSFEEALKIAREKHRPLLIYFWSDDKKGSNPDESAMLKSEKVIQLSKRFVCVKVNKSVDGELFEKFKIEQVPQLLFVRPNEEPYEAVDLGLKLESLLTAMRDVVKEYVEDTVESGGGKQQ